MAEWIKVGTVQDFKGAVLRCSVGGRQIVVFRLQDGCFALEDRCSHADSALGGGRIVKGCVVCPRHGARFDIKTGRNLTPPATRPVASFGAKVEGEDVFIAWSG
jgi:3-phenylpropionate/trans-cinnamate dioxygenase ferredoxin subunit